MRLAACGFALLLTVLPSRPAWGQSADREVMAVVQQLFDAMRLHDTVKMRAVLHPKARLTSAGATVSVETTDGWLSAVARGTEPYDERIRNPVVKVDGGLASVWVDYAFYVGERFSHCGVDAFHLVRTPEGWRIVDLADTRRKEGCTP
jgi:hypothetical protein